MLLTKYDYYSIIGLLETENGFQPNTIRGRVAQLDRAPFLLKGRSWVRIPPRKGLC